MGAKSQDPVMEGLQRIVQFGEANGTPLLPEPGNGVTAADLESLFLAELRSRRERLARWVQLIQEEVVREIARPPARPRRWHQCRSRRSCGARRPVR